MRGSPCVANQALPGAMAALVVEPGRNRKANRFAAAQANLACGISFAAGFLRLVPPYIH